MSVVDASIWERGVRKGVVDGEIWEGGVRKAVPWPAPKPVWLEPLAGSGIVGGFQGSLRGPTIHVGYKPRCWFRAGGRLAMLSFVVQEVAS